MHTFSMIRPDDWHVHFRDGNELKDTVAATANHFARALIMPNLKPPLTTIPLLSAYRQRILQHCPSSTLFSPYMTFYLNETMEPQALNTASQVDYILGAKLYPAGATTHSEAGVQCFKRIYPLLAIMEENNLVLQIHGETTSGDIFTRESTFIKTILPDFLRQFPKLRIVLEHISTRTAVEFVKNAPPTLGATITPHHLLFTRNDLLAGGIKPHFYCLPLLKSETHQRALQEAAASGNPKFFAGTDSAPHAQAQKENSCGCAGIYSAPFAISLYAEFFDSIGKMHLLEAFMAKYGALFYHLPLNTTTLELQRKPFTIPSSYSLGSQQVIPVAAGRTLKWSVHGR